MRSLNRPAAALVLAALVAGCGSTKEIDKGSAESFVRRIVTPLATSASCPSGVTPKARASFDCKLVLANGDRGTVTVHLANAGTLETAPPDLRVDSIGAQAAEEAARRELGSGVTVACPAKSPAGTGATVVCRITLADGSSGTVTEHVTGPTGGLRISRSDVHFR